MSIGELSAQCDLCGFFRPLSKMHKHPFFCGLCKQCVNSVDNKTNNHNARSRKLARQIVRGDMNYGIVTVREWITTLREHQFSCSHCQKRSNEDTENGPIVKLSLDHKLPLACGGFHMAFNIEPLCLECHALKDNNPNVSPWRAEETWKERKERRTRRLEDRNDLRKLEKLGIPVTFALYMKVRVEADKNPKAKFHELLIEHALSDWLDLRLKARSVQNASPK